MFTKTLQSDTFRAIQLASSISLIQSAYLAGGTALSLQLGHRVSVDLDYFTEAESEKKMPRMLVPVDWEKVKSFFRSEVKRLWQDFLHTPGVSPFLGIV